MSDDIVERLLAAKGSVRHGPMDDGSYSLGLLNNVDLCHEAADEIDHLRAVIATTRHTADHWRRWALDVDRRTILVPATHALCMVLTALDGETDPEQLGIGDDPLDDIPAWEDSR